MAPRLPAGVEIKPFYDRAALINRTISTVVRNSSRCAAGDGDFVFVPRRPARQPDLRHRHSALDAGGVHRHELMGVSGNLMSLGAIDFGLIVDGSVVMVENIFRRLAQNPSRDAR